MQIVLSVAVVLMALSVVAGTDEIPVRNKPSLSQTLEKFQQEVKTFADRIREETKPGGNEPSSSQIMEKYNQRLETFQKRLREEAEDIRQREIDEINERFSESSKKIKEQTSILIDQARKQ